MSNNKGITIIALVITIIILAILAGVTISVGADSYQSAKVTQYVSQLNIIQEQVNTTYAKIKNGEVSINSLGYNISDLQAKDQARINAILNGKDVSQFKFFNKAELEKIGVKNIDQQVVINFTTREIYTIDGIEYEGKVYYSHYELPNGQYNVKFTEENFNAPTFNVDKQNFGLSTKVKLTDIVYKGNVNAGTLYYGIVTNNTTSPVTVDYWREAVGTEFEVTISGEYAVKLVDKAGSQTIKTVNVVLHNAPELTDGMIPVVYDNATQSWYRADTASGHWFDYAEGKWANIMLNDGLISDGTGKITTMGSMFVWIPRYAYSITSNYHNGGQGINGNIEVKFLKETTKLTTDETSIILANASGQNNWNLHPAFTDGSKNNYVNGGWDKELTGFWVAKFEASSDKPSLDYGGGNVTTLNVKVLPNVASWRNITIANIFSNCLKMNATNNIYGLPTNAVTHQMKNSEWGAVAYLTQSKFGRNGIEITINNSSTYITGNAANSISEEANSGGVTNAYNTTKGVLASTTGTVYGIYDMSGGAWEYVAAGLTDYIDSGNSYTDSLKSVSGFSEKLVDRYAGTSSATNYDETANTARYGDGVYETSSSGIGENAWNYDFSYFPMSSHPFFVRGGACNYDTDAGVFSFSRSSGHIGNDRFPPYNSSRIMKCSYENK